MASSNIYMAALRDPSAKGYKLARLLAEPLLADRWAVTAQPGSNNFKHPAIFGTPTRRLPGCYVHRPKRIAMILHIACIQLHIQEASETRSLEESDRHALAGHLVVPICQLARLVCLLPELFNEGDIVQPDSLGSYASHVLHCSFAIRVRDGQSGSEERRESDESP